MTQLTWRATFAVRLRATTRISQPCLKALIARGVTVQVCGTCMARCGIYKNHPYFEGAESSTMAVLAAWVIDSDKVLTF